MVIYRFFFNRNFHVHRSFWPTSTTWPFFFASKYTLLCGKMIHKLVFFVHRFSPWIFGVICLPWQTSTTVTVSTAPTRGNGYGETPVGCLLLHFYCNYIPSKPLNAYAQRREKKLSIKTKKTSHCTLHIAPVMISITTTLKRVLQMDERFPSCCVSFFLR